MVLTPMALFLGGVRVPFKVLMFVSLILQVSVAGLRRRRQEPSPDMIILNRQLELTGRWLCNAPKPQLVYVFDAYPQLFSTASLWVPPAVVLHRCDKSLGCCRKYPQEKCQVEAEETVTVLFKEAGSRVTIHELSFQNHTRCSCKAAA